MIDRDAWNAFVSANPLLFHVAPTQSIPSIPSEGLRPGSEIGVSTRDDFFKTRAGRTYLIGLAEVPIVDIGPHEPRVIAVELAKLDPALVDPDEDMVAERFPDMVGQSPPVRVMDGDQEAPGQVAARARWADGVTGFDRSEVTERSLTEGRRMAYRGVIPPSALQLMETRSRVTTAFVEALPGGLVASQINTPMEGGWKVEVDRATSLVSVVTTAVRDLVHATTHVHVDDEYAAIDTSDRLRAEARSISGDGRLDEGSALSHAARIVGGLSALSGLPLSDLTEAIAIAQSAAGLVESVTHLSVGGPDYATKMATRALTVVGSSFVS